MEIQFKVSDAGVRFSELFGHCPIRVYFDQHRYADIGRFSHSVLDKFRLIDGLLDTGCLAEIGDFCEFAPCDVLLGGEHQNHKEINYVFSGCPTFQTLLSQQGVKLGHTSSGVLKLGRGVIVSQNVVILSGSHIADGVVVGASSLVKGKLEGFHIYAGNPAKKIKPRGVDQQYLKTFWESSLDTIFLHLTKKSPLTVQSDHSTRLVIKISRDQQGKLSKIDIVGRLINEVILPAANSKGFLDYASQLNATPGSVVNWRSDALWL